MSNNTAFLPKINRFPYLRCPRCQGTAHLAGTHVECADYAHCAGVVPVEQLPASVFRRLLPHLSASQALAVSARMRQTATRRAQRIHLLSVEAGGQPALLPVEVLSSDYHTGSAIL